MKLFTWLYVLCVGSILCPAQELSLQGSWQVSLDKQPGKRYTVHLPGTLDDAGIGEPNTVVPKMDAAAMAHLARKVSYVGKASYTRSFTVPANWTSKKVSLVLGRVLWQSSVWIDDQPVPATGESLVAEHTFDITSFIRPGKQQQIRIGIDNANIYPGINIYATQYPSSESREMAHSYTNHTQIKWNGVLGKIALVATPLTSISQVTITPDTGHHRLHFSLSVAKQSGQPFKLTAYVEDKKNKHRWSSRFEQNDLSAQAVDGMVDIPTNTTAWNEFSPQLYTLVTILQSGSSRDTVRTSFGLRDLTTRRGDLFLNGQRLFVRGNLECIIFPDKGYPPMTIKEWKTLLTTAKSYGLNTFRFHSWCPPAVAFEAADELGFYLQVELPHWNLQVGADTAAFAFLKRESLRILQQYGNHPSFLFFSMGNELEGDFGALNNWVDSLKARDARRLYSTTTFTFQKGHTGQPEPADDFFVTQWTAKGWVRGQGVFNSEPPNFAKDYSASTKDINIPLISHEIGQYAVYPDMKEIALYKGNLLPQNLIAIRNDLEKKGLLPLAESYLQASGKLATLLYKEEIERALKTKDFDGYQLLQLQDFPGQGTALVGLLNAFWKSKGFLQPTDFRKYCSEVVPLVRFPKAVYKNNEVFDAAVELANFYKPLQHAIVEWKLYNEQGGLVARGNAAAANYPVDNCLPAGTIRFSLSTIRKAQRLQLQVSVKGTNWLNDWPIWVYPSEMPDNNKAVTVATDLPTALQALDQGKKVLLCPAPDTLKGITGKFVPVFWSPLHFPDQPGTMGLLIKEKHSAFAHFPTRSYSEWQWWDLTIHSKTLLADSLPNSAILVRAIDNFMKNRSLTNLFEAKVGQGQLVFCSMDIVSNLSERPVAAQLRASLLAYMNSPAFRPQANVSRATVAGFFK